MRCGGFAYRARELDGSWDAAAAREGGRLHDHRSELVSALGQDRCRGARIVVGNHDHLAEQALREAGVIEHRLRTGTLATQFARVCRDQMGIIGAVEAALALRDECAACDCAGNPDRGAGCLDPVLVNLPSSRYGMWPRIRSASVKERSVGIIGFVIRVACSRIASITRGWP